MSAQVTINHVPLCDFLPDHGYATVDGKTQAGAWAYMCPLCWQLYGSGQFGTGFGQRLVLRFAPEEHAAVAARHPDRAGIYKLSEEDITTWQRSGAVPVNPDPDVVVTAPMITELGDMIVLWHDPGA